MRSRDQWLPLVLLAITLLLKICTMLALCSKYHDTPRKTHHEHNHHEETHSDSVHSNKASKKQKNSGKK